MIYFVVSLLFGEDNIIRANNKINDANSLMIKPFLFPCVWFISILVFVNSCNKYN